MGLHVVGNTKLKSVKKKIFLFLFGGLFALSLFIQYIPNTASANTAFDERAYRETWAHTAMLKLHIIDFATNCYIPGLYTVNDARGGYFLWSNEGQNVDIGFYSEPDDGRYHCWELSVALGRIVKDYWGYNEIVDFVEASGFPKIIRDRLQEPGGSNDLIFHPYRSDGSINEDIVYKLNRDTQLTHSVEADSFWEIFGMDHDMDERAEDLDPTFLYMNPDAAIKESEGVYRITKDVPDASTRKSILFKLFDAIPDQYQDVVRRDDGTSEIATKAVLYSLFYWNFADGKCGAKFSSLYSAAAPEIKAQVDKLDTDPNTDTTLGATGGFQYFPIYGIDPGGASGYTTQKLVFSLPSNFKEDDGRRMGWWAYQYGVRQPGDDDDEVYSCRQAAYWLYHNKAQADAFGQWLQANGVAPRLPGDSTTDPPPPSPDDPPGDEDGTDYSNTCEAKLSFGWLICKVLNGVDNLVDWIPDAIKSQMEITPKDYEGVDNTPTKGSLYKTWSTVRNIATIVVVLIALFMILAQILSFDFVSAYTIKKVMPRLVIAVIFMQLSWIIFANVIDIFNILGNGMMELILGPFGGESDVGPMIQRLYEVDKGAVLSGAGLGAIGVIILGVAAIGAAGISFVLIGLALFIFFGILSVFVTLAIRKIVLIFLLALAPLAIVFWVLPNTQKAWKMWWSNYSKLLMMFPIAMGFLAIGQAFASMTSYNAPSGEFVGYFIILIAYFGPMFMVPKTFKMGGSIMAAVAKGVSDLKDKSKKGIKESMPMKNLKESHQYNKQARGRSLAASGSNRLSRAYGRWQAGTTWRYGQHGDSASSAAEKQRKEDAENSIISATRNLQGAAKTEALRRIMELREGQHAEINGHRITHSQHAVSVAASQLLATGGDDQFRSTMYDLQAAGQAAAARGDHAVARQLYEQYATIQSDNFPEMKKSAADLIRAYNPNDPAFGGNASLTTPGSFESSNLSVDLLTSAYRNIIRPASATSATPGSADYDPTRGTYQRDFQAAVTAGPAAIGELQGFAQQINTIAGDPKTQREMGPQKMSYFIGLHPVVAQVLNSNGAMRMDVTGGVLRAVPNAPQEVRVIP